MSSIQIPNLPAVIGLSGAELFEGVQAGTSVKISLNQMIAATRAGLPTTLPIPVSLGGTGLNTFTIGDIMYASATQTFSKLADVALGNAIISGGVGAAPSYGKIGLTTHVSGVLPVANGGTNISSYTIGDLLYASTAGVLSKLADIAVGNALLTGGVGAAPSYGKIGLTTHVSGTLGVGNGGTGVTASTGTVSVVLSDSPALTGQVSFADGTAALPSITNTGDLNAGLFFPAADTVAVTTGGAERMRIDASGNVGIGVTPVSGNWTPLLQIKRSILNGGNSDRTELSYNYYRTSGVNTYIGTDYATLQDQISGQFRWFNAPSGTAGNAITFTQAMTLDASGNLGIGTSSPLAKVHSQVNTFTTADMVAYKAYNNQGVGVYANFQNSTTGTAITDGFLIGINDSEEAMLINYEATAMSFFTSATERVRIDSSGNVGIGTISPSAKLQVQGFSSYRGDPYTIASFSANATLAPLNIVQSNDGTNPAISAGQNSGGTYTPLSFFTSNTERMRIDASGNVGIGTSSPTAALSVNGSITMPAATTENSSIKIGSGRTGNGNSYIDFVGDPTYTDYALRIIRSVGGANATSQILHRGTGSLNITAQEAAQIIFSTTNAERMRVDSSGNVGIGESSPITPLHVAGASITTGVSYKAQPAQTSKAAAATLTIAELLTGIIQYTGAAATLTLPTGTLIEGGLPATFPSGMSFDVSFINTGAALLTIGNAASGLTLLGTMTVSTGTSGILRFRKSAANNYNAYRVA